MVSETITPDQVIFWQRGFFVLNSTICYTWGVMALLTIGSWLITRRLSCDVRLPRWQNLLEMIVVFVQQQIAEISNQASERYLPYIGTIFLFIAVSNVLAVVPGYHAPTASLSTNSALALTVLFAVPIYGITEQGFYAYLRHYVQPSALMMPFHILGELSRTLALAVRLFGNMMSGAKIAAILLAVAPLFLPILMDALGLLIGLIQAYIFAILAMVYIASAGSAHREKGKAQHGTLFQKGEKTHG
jgi:F-type H+-transporting ATPase subunit a